MTERCYELQPRDLLFLRDGRPMDVDKAQQDVRNIGHGANWPRPDHLFKAVIHGLIGDRMASLHALHRAGDDGVPAYGDFGALKVTGPYPVRDGRLYLPRPLDWDMHAEPCTGTDLPSFLSCGFIDNREGKKKYPAWISEDDYQAYLSGKDAERNGFRYGDGQLFEVETRVGTTLDARTGASRRIRDEHRSGQYQGEYLRLTKGTTMWCAVETGRLGLKKDGPEAPEMPQTLVLGGQGGLVSRKPTTIGLAERFEQPVATGEGPVFVRWTLIAPALFRLTGWCPGWCLDSRKGIAEAERKPAGTVMFDGCEHCRLIGACTGKPLVYSGWDTRDGVKDTLLAVPAGSAYLFRCEDNFAANALIAKLHLQRKSDEGPQGFGIGLCSVVPEPAAREQQL